MHHSQYKDKNNIKNAIKVTKHEFLNYELHERKTIENQQTITESKYMLILVNDTSMECQKITIESIQTKRLYQQIIIIHERYKMSGINKKEDITCIAIRLIYIIDEIRQCV